MKKSIKIVFMIYLGLFLSACNFNANIWDNINRSVESIPPEIGSITWSINAVNQYVRITFTERMNSSSINTTSITLTAGGTAVDGSWVYDDVAMTATFTPSSLLLRGYVHTVLVTTLVQDAAMNPLSASYDYDFTTPDPLAVVETSVSPANGETDVAPNAPITIFFNQAVEEASIDAVTMPVQEGGIDISGEWQYDAVSYRAMFIPGSGVTYPRSGTVDVNVTGGVHDAYGYALDTDYYSNFYVIKQASVESIVPANNAIDIRPDSTVQVQFDQPMDANTIDTLNMTVQVGGVDVGGSWEYNTTSDIAVFTLSIGTYYPRNNNVAVTVSAGVLDQFGTPLDLDYTATFTIIDYSTIVTTSPVNGDAKLDIQVPVSIEFSEEMDPASGWSITIVDGITMGTTHTIDATTPGISWNTDNTVLNVGTLHHNYGDPGFERPYVENLAGFRALSDGSLLESTGGYISNYTVRSSWEDIIGYPEQDGTIPAAGTSLRPIRMIQDGTHIYLAVLNNTSQIFVYTWDGTTWTQNNSVGFDALSTSSVDLAISNGYLCLAYIHTDGRAAAWRMLLGSVDGWIYLPRTTGGNFSDSSSRLSLEAVSDVRLVDNNGTLYASFEQEAMAGGGTGNGEPAGVYLLAWDGTNWIYAGQPGQITDYDVNALSLCSYGNQVYLEYTAALSIYLKIYNQGTDTWVDKLKKDHTGSTDTSSMAFVLGYPLVAAHLVSDGFYFSYYDLAENKWGDYGVSTKFKTIDNQRSSLYVDAESDPVRPYFVYKFTEDQQLHIAYANNPDPLNGMTETAWEAPLLWDVISSDPADAPAMVVFRNRIYVVYFESSTGKMLIRMHY